MGQILSLTQSAAGCVIQIFQSNPKRALSEKTWIFKLFAGRAEILHKNFSEAWGFCTAEFLKGILSCISWVPYGRRGMEEEVERHKLIMDLTLKREAIMYNRYGLAGTEIYTGSVWVISICPEFSIWIISFVKVNGNSSSSWFGDFSPGDCPARHPGWAWAPKALGSGETSRA